METRAQAEWLRALGCPIFQGYLFARPLSAEAATAWLDLARGGRADEGRSEGPEGLGPTPQLL